ncbi:MAG: cell surface protein SprA [Sphingobacteriales bacterium]|nr:cell surface protein SprA [Sphingobacteriales bacterium]
MHFTKKRPFWLTFLPIFIAGIAIANNEQRNYLYEWVAPETEKENRSMAPADTNDLLFPIEDRYENFFYDENQWENENSFDLQDPPAIQQQVEYNPETNSYEVEENVGGLPYRPGADIQFNDFLEQSKNKSLSDYWQNPSNSLIEGDNTGAGAGSIFGNGLSMKSGALGRVFGEGCEVSIKPTGNIEVEMGFSKQRLENPTLPERVRNRPAQFMFDENINMSATGDVCGKIKLTTNYNTKSTFKFDRQIGLAYTGDEDDIIQRLEAGNINFPLPTTLIQGSQSLMGLKSELKFGRLTVRNVISQQNSKPNQLRIENGALEREFEISGYDYEEDRNFFLAHYFRNHFNEALAYLPYINSRVEITDIEVWITNRSGATERTRDIVAFMELGESDVRPLWNQNAIQVTPGSELPGNYDDPKVPGYDYQANDLHRKLIASPVDIRKMDRAAIYLDALGLKDGDDYRIAEARLLQPNEYTFDPKLGFISLNVTPQDNDIVAVSFRYRDNLTGKVFQVGELSTDITPNSSNTSSTENGREKLIFAKMLKNVQQKPSLPIWDLMMKNIYRLGTFGLSKEDFQLNVYYENPGKGTTRYLSEGSSTEKRSLINLLNLDRLNLQNDPYPDGIFDFIDNITIFTRNGRLMFPVIEPFGADLRTKFTENEQEIAEKYAFEQLYVDTKIRALQVPEKNRFVIKGSYKSSQSNEFTVGAFNLPPGSIKVTSGGLTLTEGVDYTVNYSLGRVTIINQAYLNSALPINISFEDNTLFGIQTKTFAGTRLDYWINKDFTLGATHVWLSERPFTPKTNYGDDPISNQMVGFDMNYFAETPWLTKALDKLPLISTKEPSSVKMYGEVARFIPGHARAIGKEGTVFIDDFEGSANAISMEFPLTRWTLAATPRTTNNRFPEAERLNDRSYGYNRALFNWYSIEQGNLQGTGFGNNVQADDIPAADKVSPFYRRINITDLFPTRQVNAQQASYLRTLNLAFFPQKRGPYNFDTAPSDVSAGLDGDGLLLDPASRWGGMQRALDITDFEQANVEFIEFWMLDPFIEKPDNSGELYLNLGNVSEDILKDAGRPFAENALPRPGGVAYVDTTAWARRPLNSPITNFFDNELSVRTAQDVGFDGVDNNGENALFADYLSAVQSIVTNPDARAIILGDPSNDDFYHFSDDNHYVGTVAMAERYSHFNHQQGNAAESQGQQINSSTNLPDAEDLNNDNSLQLSEEYFEYKINLSKESLEDGAANNSNFIIGKRVVNEGTSNAQTWYQFRVPIYNYTDKYGSIENFRAIQFMRVYLTGFEDTVVCRMTEFNLVRNQWRKYLTSLVEEGEYLPDDNGQFSEFNLGSVGIEESSARVPIPYLLPPGVEREQFFNQSTTPLRQNEQSLSVQVCDIPDGYARAAFKTERFDMRFFKRLRMFIHAEERNGQTLKDGDITAFIRIGNDFTENYYEYEIPLKITRLIADGTPLDQRRQLTWPTENNLDINLDDLVDVKKRRNYQDFIPRDSWLRPYTEIDDKGNKITVVGSPDIGKAKVIMLGVRNPKQKELGSSDDGFSKCAEMWFNELRLSDFDESGGWAAIASANAKLADLGSVAVTGNMHTPGFGSLEQKVTQRTRDTYYQYDVTSNLNLDKLLPKSWGLVIPMYAGVSESISNPKYDPYDTDVEMEDKLDMVKLKKGEEYADSIKKVAQTYESVKSLNFTNVRKVKTAGGNKPAANPVPAAGAGALPPPVNNKPAKPHFYDIENWNLTYIYTEKDRRDPIVEIENDKQHTGILAYTFPGKATYIQPFNKIITSKNKYLAIIKDINFNLVPSNVSFRNKVDRSIFKIKMRNLENDGFEAPTSYNKDFIWTREYGLKHNLTKSITLDFNAMNRSRIDEPMDSLTGALIPTPNKEQRKVFYDNIKTGGRDLDYNHNASLSYNVPLNKFPILDWITLRTRLDADFTWTTAPRPPRKLVYPFSTLDSLSNGNFIQNGRSEQINAEFNVRKFVTKIKYFDRLYNAKSTNTPPKDKNKDKKDKDAKEEEKDKDKKEKKSVAAAPSLAEKIFLKPLFSLNRVAITYNRKRSTQIAGFGFIGENRPDVLGQNLSVQAPGWDFVSGWQPDTSWLSDIAEKGWIIDNKLLNQEFRQTYERRLEARAAFEPFRDFKIDLIWNKTYRDTYNELFKMNEEDRFAHLTPRKTGNYSVTFLPINTTFDKLDTARISETFKQFEINRKIISQRLQAINPESQGEIYFNPLDSLYNSDYAKGYGPFSQEVIIPAFLAAYTKQDANKVSINNALNVLPRPNWTLQYNGLAKLPKLRDIFTTINIGHSYSATYTVNTFTSNLYFEGQVFEYDPNYIAPVVIDTMSGNFQVQYRIPDLTVNEQFSPLLGREATMKNGFTGKFEYKKQRSISLLFVDRQLSEMRTSEITVGAGYRFKGLKLPIKNRRGNPVTLKNDINVKMDFSVRDSRTLNYQLDQKTAQPTAGSKTIRISPSVDYVVNNRIKVALFYDRTRTVPYTSASFPITNSRGGIRITFSLAN